MDKSDIFSESGSDGSDGADGADEADKADGADGADEADKADGSDEADGADGSDVADEADGADEAILMNMLFRKEVVSFSGNMLFSQVYFLDLFFFCTPTKTVLGFRGDPPGGVLDR